MRIWRFEALSLCRIFLLVKKVFSALSLSAQMYQWVPAKPLEILTKGRVVSLCWISIPFRLNTPSCFNTTEGGVKRRPCVPPATRVLLCLYLSIKCLGLHLCTSLFPGNTHLWGDTQEKEITYNLYSRPTEFAPPVRV